MYRGTTPTLIFTLPFACEKIDTCSIAFAQREPRYGVQTQVVLEKALTYCVATENDLSLTLSEEDTLKLDSSQDVEIQLRVRCGSVSMASEIFRTPVGRILKDGRLP